MILKKQSLLILAVLMMTSSAMYAKKHKPRKQKCTTQESCLNNPQCQCYCAEKGGFRDKVANDKPVYIEDDPSGVHCYCKEWDLKAYPGPAVRPQPKAQRSK